MPSTTLAVPSSPARTRSVSQPIREDVATDFTRPEFRQSARSHSSNSIARATAPSGPPPISTRKGRARSSSLVTVTEVGGDAPENVIDRSGVGANENAAWVNAPGAWIIHPVLIGIAKALVDAIPGITQDLSWTIVNLGYMAASFTMFHHVTGVPFDATMTVGGAYDDLTMWEQIDSGAQYTPAKKFLTSVPICLFLISTHYTRYDYTLFALNFAALICVLFPKLPMLHRLRFHFGPPPGTEAPTPVDSRPPSPFVDRRQ